MRRVADPWAEVSQDSSQLQARSRPSSRLLSTVSVVEESEGRSRERREAIAAAADRSSGSATCVYRLTVERGRHDRGNRRQAAYHRSPGEATSPLYARAYVRLCASQAPPPPPRAVTIPARMFTLGESGSCGDRLTSFVQLFRGSVCLFADGREVRGADVCGDEAGIRRSAAAGT